MFIAFFEADIPDRCGAFYSDLCLARELKSRGHQIILISCAQNNRNFSGGEYEGFQWKPYITAGKELDKTNIWISPHYPHGNIVRRLNRDYNRPVIFTLHFAGAQAMFKVPLKVTWNETIWYVNQHIETNMMEHTFPPFVAHHELRRPFIDAAPILLDEPGTHEYITLVNANMIKGLVQFLKIAEKMPNHKFLAIRSFYLPPTDPTLKVSPNITWIDFTRDIKSIYARTRIMLVLSGSESFCITAAESMINGIPVIYCTPTGENFSNHMVGSTEGVQEWIDPVGISLPRDDTDAWVSKILELDDSGTYSAISNASREHAKSVFDTAGSAADYVVSFSQKNPVKPNSLTTIQHDSPRPTGLSFDVPTVPQRPSQPAAWRNGRLTFGRR